MREAIPTVSVESVSIPLWARREFVELTASCVVVNVSSRCDGGIPSFVDIRQTHGIPFT